RPDDLGDGRGRQRALSRSDRDALRRRADPLRRERAPGAGLDAGRRSGVIGVEPERPDEPAEPAHADAPGREDGEDDLERAAPQLEPGDSDLADAWWAL